MIVDMRTYSFLPGRVGAWLRLYEEFGWPLQRKYLGNCLGFYTTVEGQLHKVVHLWGYDSMADREARRGAMLADPGWALFMEKVAQLDGFTAQENVFLKPAPFFQGA